VIEEGPILDLDENLEIEVKEVSAVEAEIDEIVIVVVEVKIIARTGKEDKEAAILIIMLINYII